MPNTNVVSTGSLNTLFQFLVRILEPERSYYWLAVVYGVGISLLTLALPISVQMLINTVANIALVTPLVVLSLSLFGLLLVAGALNALRIYIMDVFGRRFYARVVSEISLRSIYASNPFFDDRGDSALFNRYFDIIIVIKMLPNLLVGGFTIALQTVVGFILVSSYHPLLLVFNLVLALLIWIVWAIWGRRGIRSAVELSHRKHYNAAWLESLGHSNGFYKSEREVGNKFGVDVEVSVDFDQAAEHDNLQQTVNYEELYKIVREEMEQPSKLLEHVADKICCRILSFFAAVSAVTITVRKFNPPIKGICRAAKVELTRTKNQTEQSANG